MKIIKQVGCSLPKKSFDEFPDRFGVFDSEPERSMGIHRMVVDNFLVCYVIDYDIVTVTAVFYGALNIHDRLQNRNYENRD